MDKPTEGSSKVSRSKRSKTKPRTALQDEMIELAVVLTNHPDAARPRATLARIANELLERRADATIDQAIESEAQAQAVCMKTEDFRRAYEAFVAKARPKFAGD